MQAATVVTDRDAFETAAAAAAPETRVPVVATLRADPFAAYRRARGDEPAFLYETSGGRDGWGYFGVSPNAFVEVDADGRDATDERDEGAGGATLERIEALLGDESLARGDCEIPFPGGWFGWLSYDVAREIEALPATTDDDRGLPRLQLGRYPTIAAWEEAHDGETTLRLVAAVRSGTDPGAAYDRALERLRMLARAATAGDPTVEDPPVSAPSVSFSSSCGRAAYADRVRSVREYVREGDTFQANVSHQLTAPAAVAPVHAYAALREANPAPYSGLLEFPGVDLVSASPELLLERGADELRTEPIAGTRPRGDDPVEDARLEDELRGDEKERAEHAMLVDLERNDLGKVSGYGSVTVDEYRRVDRYSEVMHLVSLVSGTPRADASVADAIRAVFPGGTITGAPKPRTMEIIDELESTRRGPYTGSMAALGFDGRATLNIVIRTLVRHADEYHLRVGAGIVHDSVPEREYDETLAKARALVDAVDDALGERVAMGVER